MSKATTLLSALLNGEPIEDFEPRSRVEAYLKNCCLACGCDGLPEPLTEMDALLYALAEKLAAFVELKNQDKTFTENGTYAADEGFTGLGVVTVNVEPPEPVLQELTITENGEYLPSNGAVGFSKVVANIYIPTAEDIMATLPKWEGGSY